MPRVTKKIPKHATKHTKQSTVPNIRRDLELFYTFLRTDRTDAQIKKKFQEIFGMKLSDKRALELKKGQSHAQPKTQKGGMAPLDYSMGSPDKSLSAVPYLQRGFGFANMNSLQELSPKEYLGSTPQMGGKRKTRRQKGGGVADFAASVLAQPFLSSAPMTGLQSAAHLASGQGGLASPLPEVNPIPMSYSGTVFGARLV